MDLSAAGAAKANLCHSARDTLFPGNREKEEEKVEVKTNAKIYVMADDEGRLKVGHSREPQQRIKTLRRYYPSIRLLSETEVKEQAERIERTAHRLLALDGKHIKDEWFRASLEDALAAIGAAEDIVSGKAEPLTSKQLKALRKRKNFSVSVDQDLLDWLDGYVKRQNKKHHPYRTTKSALFDQFIHELRESEQAELKEDD